MKEKIRLTDGTGRWFTSSQNWIGGRIIGGNEQQTLHRTDTGAYVLVDRSHDYTSEQIDEEDANDWKLKNGHNRLSADLEVRPFDKDFRSNAERIRSIIDRIKSSISMLENALNT